MNDDKNNENNKIQEKEELIYRPIILKDLKLDVNKLYVFKSGPINKIATSTLKKYKFFPAYQLKKEPINEINKENNSVNNEKENSNLNENNNNNKSDSESISLEDHKEYLGKKRKKIKNNNNLENNLNNNLNNNIENNNENNNENNIENNNENNDENNDENNNNIEKPSECFSCSWKFPKKMTLNEINNHINECLDGKGEKNRLEYEKTYKLLNHSK